MNMTTITPPQPQTGTMELNGHLFEIAGWSTDRRGNSVPVPGKHLGKVQRSSPPPTVPPKPSAPPVKQAAPSTPPPTPAKKPRRRYQSSGMTPNNYFRTPSKPLQITYEPTPLASRLTTLAVWVVIAVVVWLLSKH